MQQQRILFVSNGNQCRSPLAEALLQDMVNKKAHWPGARRIYVTSAGTLQIGQQPATNGAIQVMYEKGLDIGSHRSRRIDERLVDWSDVILVMEDKHKNYIHSRVLPEC